MDKIILSIYFATTHWLVSCEKRNGDKEVIDTSDKVEAEKIFYGMMTALKIAGYRENQKFDNASSGITYFLEE
ncbi:hypothetical protein KKA66_03565 [Patescibacteria group bacterium]|nr:hypothetical protein [Patescibacteria group bacterium]